MESFDFSLQLFANSERQVVMELLDGMIIKYQRWLRDTSKEQKAK